MEIQIFVDEKQVIKFAWPKCEPVWLTSFRNFLELVKIYSQSFSVGPWLTKDSSLLYNYIKLFPRRVNKEV